MLKQKLILSYSSQIVFQVLQVAASLVVARVAGPTVLGTVAFGTAYVSTLLFVADLGLVVAHIKMVSEGRDEQQCLSTFAVLKTATTLLFVLVVLGLFFAQKYLLGYEFESRTHEQVIFISLVGLTVNQLLFIPRGTFAAKTEQAKIDTSNLLQGFILQPARIVVVLLGFGAIALAVANLASYLLTVPFMLYLFRGHRLRLSSFDRRLAREYIVMALPVIIIGMSTSVIHQIDKVLLQFFSNSEQVGYYTAGYKIGGFILLIGKSVKNLFFPLFSKAVAEGNRDYIRDKITRFERFSFIFIMPAVVLVAILSEPIILLLLGDQYAPSVVVMQLITLAMCIMVVNMPFGSVIDGLGKFRLSAILNTLNLVFFAGAIVLLVSPQALDQGAAGVAIAIFASNTFIGILYRVYATRYFPVLSHRKALKFFTFGALSFALGYYVYEQVFDTNWGLRTLFAVLYLAAVYGIFTLFRWMTPRDWRDLLSVFDFGSMKKYVTGEIKKR